MTDLRDEMLSTTQMCKSCTMFKLHQKMHWRALPRKSEKNKN